MPARKPQDLPRLFIEAFNAGDLDAIMALYEPDAVLAPQPGQQVSGTEAIREAISGFFALNPRFEGQTKRLLQAGDLALAHLAWRIIGTGPDGNPIELTDTSADVFRRQPDGTWLIVIDNPWTIA